MEPAGRGAFASTQNVSRETLQRLDIYEALLRKWQRSHNLVGPKTLDEVWTRHFADSAQVLAAVPDARVWVDLGSGAGFPGLVIAILLAHDPATRVHLVEVDTRKCAFLREVIRATCAPATVHNQGLEAFEPATVPDAVTARALASLDQLVAWTLPYLKKGVTAVFPKGRSGRSELTRLPRIPNIHAELKPSLTDAESHLVLLRWSE